MFSWTFSADTSPSPSPRRADTSQHTTGDGGDLGRPDKIKTNWPESSSGGVHGSRREEAAAWGFFPSYSFVGMGVAAVAVMRRMRHMHRD